MNFELLAVIVLILLAVGDLIVGVVNDAVNFLNSAIGANVATRKTILFVASIGIIIGATFSDGIIEVARKGIFYPSFFTSQEAIMIFTAVAVADIILLDLYSTFGLPTSTTVSIVFELLGAAFIMGLLKIGNLDGAWEVINSTSAIKIIVGIVLSVGIAFLAGLIAQFITRLLFTFDYKKRLSQWGFLWCGAALTALVFFILLKGSSHATFMTPALEKWIQASTSLILWSSLLIFSTLSYVLIKLRVNILKVIVLIGTGSLAMAFAGNDLANFIGVAVAGAHAFTGANLSETLPTPSWAVILAGIIMAGALFRSKKARTVADTEINLASHKKHVMAQWKKNGFSVSLVKVLVFLYSLLLFAVPNKLQKWIRKSWRSTVLHEQDGPAFDLLRAGVNLMVAAIVISYATSKKLPLSTTYVTFMVAMGTALADGAWSRECSPNRINGVMTVVGGWFVTAFLAFVMSGIIVSGLYYFNIYGLIFFIFLVLFVVYKLAHLHQKRTSKSFLKIK